MIKKIILGNFFSFGKETVIELDPDINILVGINGSGKSNLLKAIRLLYDGVVGHGFEKTFLKEWGGFDNVAHCGREARGNIRLRFEFDRKVVENYGNPKDKLYKDDFYYTINIKRNNKTLYSIGEVVSPISDQKTSYLVTSIADSFVSIRALREDGIYEEETYGNWGNDAPLHFDTSELVLRQISDPQRYPELFLFKKALEKLSVYEYFDTTLRSPIRQANNFDIEKRLLYDGQNLTSILQRMKNHHAFA